VQIAQAAFGQWRLVVRRTQLVGLQAELFPDRRHHTFLVSRAVRLLVADGTPGGSISIPIPLTHPLNCGSGLAPKLVYVVVNDAAGATRRQHRRDAPPEGIPS
jgi:hypothetical protein